MYGFPPTENHSSKRSTRPKKDKKKKPKKKPSQKGRNPNQKRKDGIDPDYRFSLKDIMQQRYA